MAIHYKTVPSGTAIYTWIDQTTGENWHVHVPLLREYIAKRQASAKPFDVKLAPVDESFARTFLDDNSVDLQRVIQLGVEVTSGKRKLDPIILCERGTYTNGNPDVLLVDGHHRYCLCAMAGEQFIPCFCLSMHQWKRFRIVGAPDMNVDQLRDIPILKRNY